MYPGVVNSAREQFEVLLVNVDRPLLERIGFFFDNELVVDLFSLL